MEFRTKIIGIGATNFLVFGSEPAKFWKFSVFLDVEIINSGHGQAPSLPLMYAE